MIEHDREAYQNATNSLIRDGFRRGDPRVEWMIRHGWFEGAGSEPHGNPYGKGDFADFADFGMEEIGDSWEQAANGRGELRRILPGQLQHQPVLSW